MAKERQARKATVHTDLHEQAILDRRLSQLEVGIFIIGLFCLFVFGAVFLNNQILKNHTVQMTSRAQSVADWIAASHKVRMRNAGLAPERCQRAKSPLSTCFQDMVAPGQPFEGLKNIYSADHATAPAFAFVDVPHSGDLLADGRPRNAISMIRTNNAPRTKLSIIINISAGSVTPNMEKRSVTETGS